jgi:8-oxo-dGTP pyrophosphatase MutT (NUDIX family)
MSIDFSKLSNRKPTICDRETYHEFSVLVPIVQTSVGKSLLFEIRSEKLSNQPNEICFPGGKIENMESPQHAAVRETSEELLITENSIKTIGELDTIVTPFNSIIYAFVGELVEYSGTFSPEEVKNVFSVPLSFFEKTKPIRSFIDIKMKPGADFPYENIREGRNYPWGKGRYPVYFYIFEDKIIWGITARIVHNFLSILSK